MSKLLEKRNLLFRISERRTSESQEKITDINQDFVSEDYDASALSMDDIRREIEQLTIPKKSSTNNSSGNYQ